MPKIVLYNPQEKRKIRTPTLPLSLLFIGSSLEKEGYDVKIIDARVEDNPHKMVLDTLDNDTICFCISCMTGSPILDALKIAKIVKEKRDIPIIWGGFHPSLLPEQTIKNPYVDAVVKGAGEKTTIKLVKSIESGKFRRGIHSGDAEINFSRLDYGLVDIERYIRSDINSRSLDYLSSRGCPMRCTFCCISRLYGKQWKTNTVGNIIKDLEYFVNKYKINGIHFFDDNFFVDKKRVEEICDKIIKKKLNIKMWAMARCDVFSRFDKNFLLKLKQAGFTTINMGAESGSDKILKRLQKDITVEQIIKTAKLCKECDLRAEYSFMMAYPYETQEDFNKTLELIDKLNKICNPDIKLLIYTPLPGTKLFNDCLDYGLNSPQNLEEWGSYEYEHIVGSWITPKQAGLYRTLTHLVWFLYTPNMELKYKKLYQRLGYRILKKLALFRWNHKFFRFPLEWRLVEKFVNR